MGITTIDPKSRKPVPERRKYDWEEEETLVERRKRLRYRLMRTFTLRRIIIVGLILAALLSADVMTFILNIIP